MPTYRSTGGYPARLSSPALSARRTWPSSTHADPSTVREALKDFRVPRELARSPLATGTTVLERAESVRNLLRQATDEAFGDSDSEKLLNRVLVAGYLEPMRSHEEAASTLCLSRAAYFRRLKTAVERLAEHMATPGQPLAGVPGSSQDPQDHLMPGTRPA